MKRIAAVAACALTLACVTEADRFFERSERRKLASLHGDLAKHVEEYRRLGLRSEAEKATEIRLAIVKQESAYRAACEKCAAGEKCEAEARHIRQVGEQAYLETACP